RILRDEPEMADGWTELAAFADRIDRFDLAIDAFKHTIELKPSDPEGYLGASAMLFKDHKFEEARDHAERAAEMAARREPRLRVAARELLVKIALARHDAAAARREAALAHDDDSATPLVSFVEGRVLYDQGKFADALPHFEQAIAAQ